MAKILILYTGGTIGMTKSDASNALQPVDFNNLLKQIHEIKWLSCTWDVSEADFIKDSSDISPTDWALLAKEIERNYHQYDGFVVLHGTDTMSYTASALSFMIEGLSKPIIFTGSQLPMEDLRTDAKENLLTAMYYASLEENGKPIIQEVCIYFEYHLYRANRTTKKSAFHFDAFSSPNYPSLGQSGVNLEVNTSLLWKNENALFKVNPNFSSQIAMFKSYPGMPMAVWEILKKPEIKAFIIEAFGAGNLPQNEIVMQLLADAIENKKPVIILTQCLGGAVQLGKYDTSRKLLEMGAISGHDLTTESGYTKALYLLNSCDNFEEFKYNYTKNLRGEISIS